jgi:isoleucyl-tRNA synthetase
MPFPKKKSKNIVIKEVNGYKVGLDTKLTKELLQEGLYRDLVRAVQNARKQAGLNVGEKVVLSLVVDSQELKELVEAKEDMIKTDVTVTEVSVKVGEVSAKSAKVGEYNVDIVF